MKKNVLVYGLISGAIVSVFMLTSMNYFSHCEGNVDMSTSMAIGYASMLLAFSLVYVGTRNYRDKFQGGVISFGKAFQVGILIVLIASTMYVVAWMIYFFGFDSSFIEKYSSHMLAELKSSGASAEKIEKETKEMADFAVMYKKPWYNAMMTYVEILPVGIIVTLISSLILKKKKKNEEQLSFQ